MSNEVNVPSIDLNSDVGELPEALEDADQERLVLLVSSINIACGGHAGDEHSMLAYLQMAKAAGIAAGAHPGYPDRRHFGRVDVDISPEALNESLLAQLELIDSLAARAGVRIGHVKPHGALYNRAARDPSIAAAFADVISRWRTGVVLVGLAGSPGLSVWGERGFRTAAEAFVDRRYEPDGSLRSRAHADSLITEPAAAADQAASIVVRGAVRTVDGSEIAVSAETLCIHSDTPNALAVVRAVRARLEDEGLEIRSF